jgi:hypothetical protein
MTARLPPDTPGEWLTIQQAADRLGLSPSGFRGLAKTRKIPINRRGNRPGVQSTDIDAFVPRARITPRMNRHQALTDPD